ncbi:MAG: SdrD B-like domain-containing protein [Kiritimatiellia bacterium]
MLLRPCLADGSPVVGDGALVTTLSDSEGYYAFEGLAPGEYRRDPAPAGFTKASDADGGGPDEIGDVADPPEPGFDAYDRDFVDALEADPSSPAASAAPCTPSAVAANPRLLPLPGVLLALLNGAGNLQYRDREPYHTVSGPDGGYCFTNLFLGTYQVVQPEQPPDYESLGDADGGDPNAIGNEIPIEIAGETREITGADFLEREYGSVAGRVFHDLDRDGLQDPGEPGVGGVTVALLDTNDVEFVSTGTAGDGTYLLFNLSPGNYRAVFRDLPPDFVFSPASQGSGTDDSDPDPGSGITPSLFLDVGDDLQNIDAGINLPSRPVATDDSGTYTPGVDRVVFVLDNDTTGDPIIPSTVRIRDGVDAELTLAVPGQGEWNVNTGDGTITFTPDPGYEGDPTPIQYTGEDAFANVSNPATVTLTAEPQPSRIDGVVWADEDGDGARDAGEPLLQGVLVRLLDEDGFLVATNTTDAAGAYSFPGLFLPRAIIEFDPDSLPLPHSFTTRDNAPDFEDSDADGVTGRTALITLVEGETVANVDAGFVPPCVVGRVWLDANANGLQDSGESGLTGLEVRLPAESMAWWSR